MTAEGHLIGRVAIITGASRGIGAGIAERFAAEGAQVFLLARTLHAGDHRFAGSLEETVDRIRAAGGTADAAPVDLADPQVDMDKVVAEVEGKFGAVDILVNNATYATTRTFDTTRRRDWELAVQVNVWAPWQLLRSVVPVMRRRGGGAVVNLSSFVTDPTAPIVGDEASTVGLAYAISKAAMENLTRRMAASLSSDGIAINAVAPRAAVMTEAASQFGAGRISLEPVETLVEAVLDLALATPETRTGAVVSSLAHLSAVDRPVRTLDGSSHVADWQPEDIRHILRPLNLIR